MSSIDTWSPWVAILVTGAPGLLGLMNIAYSLYLSSRQLDAMKNALKNSRYIYLWGPSLGKRGLILSLLEIAKITGMIMMPKAYIRLGDLNPVDLENFPAGLKQLLKINFLILTIGCAWLVVVCLLLHFK
ncbi:hypothetical protein [Pseudomonas sp. FP2309]|uniref:hypothetical protein n=1 Tax=Pseudomonas sp. FP2309 TaxID=2954091 RepID=UPI0027331AF4|nr:hypothetical protein [Pseudomonas sp. FP2309]WLH69822.1 hypothetical protein PSH59_06790 [Pseudomonas sp. FP2309]